MQFAPLVLQSADISSIVSMRNPLLPFFAQVSNAYAFESNCCSQCHIGTKCTHNGEFVSRTQLYECITGKGGHYNRWPCEFNTNLPLIFWPDLLLLPSWCDFLLPCKYSSVASEETMIVFPKRAKSINNCDFNEQAKMLVATTHAHWTSLHFGLLTLLLFRRKNS